MDDGEVLAVCLRDAVAEVIHRAADLSRSRDELAALRGWCSQMVMSSFTGDVSGVERSQRGIGSMLSDRGGELNREL